MQVKGCPLATKQRASFFVCEGNAEKKGMSEIVRSPFNEKGVPERKDLLKILGLGVFDADLVLC